MLPGGDAEALAYERSLPEARRKAGGVFYTPPAVVEDLVEATIGRALAAGVDADALTVIDPACGAGAFLVGAYQRLLRWYAARGPVNAELRRKIIKRSIFGVDVDAGAIEVARRALARVAAVEVDPANVRVGDAIRGEDRRTYTVVLANPPYVDSEAMARGDMELRRYCSGRYAAASGNWDLFCVFVERGIQLCAPGGWCGMLVPNKLASAGYASAARGLLVGEGCRLISVRDYREVGVFAAGVYPIAFVAERGAARQREVVFERMGRDGEVAERAVLPAEAFAEPRRPWALCSGAAGRVVEKMRAAGRALGEVAEVRGAATVAEAYAIAGLIREGEEGLRIINSGTIDAYASLWGKRRLRYLGASYLRPVIPPGLEQELPAKRLREARLIKVIVSGMTRSLEAVLDARGEWLAGKSTTIVTGTQIDLRVVTALLNSRAIGWYYRQVFGGDQLAGGYLRVGPPQLRQVPVVVTRDDALAGLAEAMGARHDPGIAAAIDARVEALLELSADEVATIVESMPVRGAGR